MFIIHEQTCKLIQMLGDGEMQSQVPQQLCLLMRRQPRGAVDFPVRQQSRGGTCAAAGYTVFHLHFSSELKVICIFIIALGSPFEMN